MVRNSCVYVSVLALAAGSAFAETRELDAHEHGHGALNIAIEGDQIAIELEVPGFDIVGFEYVAETDADKATVEAALATLGDPMNLFTLPEGAGCAVAEVEVELHGEDDHDEHGHDDDHAEGEEHHDDDHAEGEEHADGDDHKHEEHADGEEHHDDEHGEEAVHSEFHAQYLLDCSDVAAVSEIALPYFSAFENAEELEVQLVTDKGAVLMEATPETAVLDLSKAM